MKTQPIRADNHCLNCGTEVPERYCSHCGQENAVPHETFGHLFNHFFADVIHYDSKTLITLKYLLFRPGFLTKEYTAGKRVRYVNPIKLYIFISFVFYFFYFMLSNSHENNNVNIVYPDKASMQEAGNQDSTAKVWLAQLGRYENEEEYKKAQEALPEEKRDGFIKRQTIHTFFKQKERKEKGESGNEHFQHNYPKMMFVLLPLFALFLKWFYNERRQWYYADHAIFSLHFHCFFFIFYLFTTTLDYLFHTDWISLAGLAVIFTYLVIAMKRIYGGRPFWKALGLTVVYGFTLMIVFTTFTVLIAFLT